MLTDEQIEEMMARVRKLELKARRLVRESFAGEYLSSFRGQGLDFDDFREYQHGDEVRFIDWNVTARMNTPFVRKFREERELTVMLVVDISASHLFGSGSRLKKDLAAELACILAFYSDPLDKPLGKLARKHETVALRVADPLESKLPKAGKVVMIDAETGFETLVNTDNPNLRMAYQKLMSRQYEGVASVFHKHGIDSAQLATHGDTLAELHRLLKRRSRKRIR